MGDIQFAKRQRKLQRSSYRVRIDHEPRLCRKTDDCLNAKSNEPVIQICTQAVASLVLTRLLMLSEIQLTQRHARFVHGFRFLLAQYSLIAPGAVSSACSLSHSSSASVYPLYRTRYSWVFCPWLRCSTIPSISQSSPS